VSISIKLSLHRLSYTISTTGCVRVFPLFRTIQENYNWNSSCWNIRVVSVILSLLFPPSLSLSLLHTSVVCHLSGCWVSHRQESTESPSIYSVHARHDGRCSSPLCPGLRNRYMRASAPLLLYYCDRYEMVVLDEFNFALSANLQKKCYVTFANCFKSTTDLDRRLQYGDLSFYFCVSVHRSIHVYSTVICHFTFVFPCIVV
jgi:hypothetical protein